MCGELQLVNRGTKKRKQFFLRKVIYWEKGKRKKKYFIYLFNLRGVGEMLTMDL
jgi:hypothetical protein